MDDRKLKNSLLVKKKKDTKIMTFISACPKEQDVDNYEIEPVDGYGLNLLKSMGLKQDLKIGKTNAARNFVKNVNIRPKRQGLGSFDKKKIKNRKETDFPAKKSQKIDDILTEKSQKNNKKVKKSKKSEKSKKINWVTENLIVRFVQVDQPELKLKKALIIDVVSPSHILVQTLYDHHLVIVENEEMLETVVGPKNSQVIFVGQSGHRGKLGNVINKSVSRNQALVQLLDEVATVETKLDQICAISSE